MNYNIKKALPLLVATVVAFASLLLSGCFGIGGNVASRPVPQYGEDEAAVATVTETTEKNGVVVKKTTKTTSYTGLEVARQGMLKGDDVIRDVAVAKATGQGQVSGRWTAATNNGSYVSTNNAGNYSSSGNGTTGAVGGAVTTTGGSSTSSYAGNGSGTGATAGAVTTASGNPAGGGSNIFTRGNGGGGVGGVATPYP